MLDERFTRSGEIDTALTGAKDSEMSVNTFIEQLGGEAGAELTSVACCECS